MKIRIVNHSRHPLPDYETIGSSGVDLRASLDEVICLKTLERALIPTGLLTELPIGLEAQVHLKSRMDPG